jgi:predicted amidohydrolase YtcJ
MPTQFRARANQARVLLAVIVFAAAAGGVSAADGPLAETVYCNAHVFTAEPDKPYAEAVAIRGDRIIAVGSCIDATAAAGTSATRVDLHGRFLMPGMIDAHAHPIGAHLVFGGGLGLVMANFPDQNGSVPDLVRYVAATVDQGTSRFGDVILVNGVDLAYWPHAAEIDTILSAGRYARIPIVLTGSDGHTAWCNRVARVRAGITADYLRKLSAAQRHYYGSGADFEPNGFVVDVGLTRLRQSLPVPPQALLASAGEAAVQRLNSLGITGWLDAAAAGVVGGDIPLAADEPGDLPVYRELARRGKLTAHVAAYPVIHLDGGLEQLDVVETLRRRFADVPGLSVAGIKVFADGVVEFPSQTAALTRPYRNMGKSSPVLFEQNLFNALVIAADRRGLIVHIHAIGDLAVKESLDAFEAARRANPASVLPHTLTHAQFVDAEDVPRFAKEHVIAALQLKWAVADPTTIDDVKPYIDPAIHARMYPARSMLEAGTTIAGASDWPVDSANPFVAMAVAETRSGPQGVLDAGQRMPREAMLYAYTRNSAQVLNQLDSIGTLAPGKRADLVLVDRDLLVVSAAELRDAKVVWTMFGGRTVYGTAP